ncbi:MAG: hypothetical protein M3N93_09930 [Acidobacteriota bacterium]|nr:hypothetical protein [Acidobacteriota bacterium]
MTCPLRTEQTDILLDDSAGRLDAAATAALKQHMDCCADCASFRRKQAAVWEALDLWAPPAVGMDFNRNLWRRIEATAAAPWYRNLAQSLGLASWKPLLPLTAAVALIATGFMLDHPGGGAHGKAGFTLNEAQQVEQTLDDIQLLRQLDAGGISQDSNPKTM